MRLIACHIENFGKLRELDDTFQAGVNVIHEENGWGKTTFAAFIKAMFYGLPSSTKRSVLENERKKYLPWQGGSYGGNLTFENERGTYRIERFFGEKDKDDTFVLYDQTTGLESHDYSSMIGEELFGINLEGYERSVYIPQMGLNITANDSINAKLSHLLDDGNDINNYETALSSLEEAMKVYKKTGNRGRLAELESQLADIDRTLERSAGTEEALPIWEARLKSKREELTGLAARQQGLKQRVVAASQYEAQKARHEHYAQLCGDKRRIEALRQERKDFFKGHEPTEEELLEKMMQQDSLGELSAKIAAEEEKRSFYEQAYQETGDQGKDHTRAVGYVMGAAALLFGITAAVLFIRLMSVVLGSFAVVAGIIALTLCLILIRRSYGIRTETDKRAQELSEKYRAAGINIEPMQKLSQAHEEELSGMVRFYFHDMKPSEARACIEELRRRKQALCDIDAEYARICDAVTKFEQQNHIAGQAGADAVSAEDIHESLQELQRQESETEKSIEAVRTEIAEIEAKTEHMGMVLEEKAELESERERVTAELVQNRERYEVLEDTAKYLKKAKEALSTHYFGELQDSFHKYMQTLCTSLSGLANMDVSSQVKVEAAGARRELNLYSEGYKDMVGICTRLALIDVLFAEEKPFIVLDDPFASLDEAKLEGMLQMLQTIGREYQLIYFVCHNSRSLS